jgi:predicted deacetylase
MKEGRQIAVAIHDVEPATYSRCAEIRGWLDQRGIERATLLVIPAADLHPLQTRRPDMLEWLRDQVASGDAVAQHGFTHRRARSTLPPRSWLVRWQGGAACEFPGLDAAETKSAVDSGRRVLKLAGLEPRGFVAPGYAYTRALREQLATRFEWWGELLGVHGNARRPGRRTPALCLGSSGVIKRATSPAVVRACSLLSPPLLRLDIHPADFDHVRHVQVLDAIVRRSGGRAPITYDDLLAS